MTMQNFGQMIRRPEVQARIADFQNRFGGGMPPAQPPARPQTTGGLRTTTPTERNGRDLMAQRRQQLAAAYQARGPAAATPQERGFAPQARPDITARVAAWNARANSPAALNSLVADNPDFTVQATAPNPYALPGPNMTPNIATKLGPGFFAGRGLAPGTDISDVARWAASQPSPTSTPPSQPYPGPNYPLQRNPGLLNPVTGQPY